MERRSHNAGGGGGARGGGRYLHGYSPRLARSRPLICRLCLNGYFSPDGGRIHEGHGVLARSCCSECPRRPTLGNTCVCLVIAHDGTAAVSCPVRPPVRLTCRGVFGRSLCCYSSWGGVAGMERRSASNWRYTYIRRALLSMLRGGVETHIKHEDIVWNTWEGIFFQ